VLLLEGAALVGRDGEPFELLSGELAVLDAGLPWWIEAREEAAVLLTMTWPEEKSLV
jgi:quercetin dioxygenase-like cupin family protein